MNAVRNSCQGDLPDASALGQHNRGHRRRRGTPRAADVSSVPPLHWWRRLQANALTDVHRAILRKAVSGIGMIGEPRWTDAAIGDAAAAIGVALRAVKSSCTPRPQLDLVMSALLRCAIAGDAAAINALTHVLGLTATDDPSCALIAASWQSRMVARRRCHMLRGG